MSNNLYIALVLLALSAWMIQISLSILQVQRYYKRLRQLRQLGHCATGLGGTRYKGRAYGVLVVNPQTDIIIRAERLAGVTVFAKLSHVPELEGITVQQLMTDASILAPFSKRQAAAFIAAATTYQDGIIAEAEKAKATAVTNNTADKIVKNVAAASSPTSLPSRSTPARVPTQARTAGGVHHTRSTRSVKSAKK